MKKLSALMLLSATMILASCGKPAESKPAESKPAETTSQVETESKPESVPSTPAPSTPVASSSQAPASSSTPAASSSKPASSSSKPVASSSQAPASSSTPTVTGTVAVATVDLVVESNVAYLKVTGTIDGLTGNAAKFALGLKHKTDASGGVTDPLDGEWLVGSETPAAADYKFVPTIANGSFEVKLSLAGITWAKGAYEMYVGPQGHYEKIDLQQADYGAGSVKANGLKMILRGDRDLIYAEELPPVLLTESTVVVEEEKAILKVGGELGSATEAEFLALTVKVTAERQVGGYNKSVIDAAKVTTAVEGTKGYVKIDVTALGVGGYQIKLGFDGTSAPNTVMECDSYDMRETPTVVGTKGFAPYFAAGTNDADHLYGCCGLFVSHIHNMVRGDKLEGSDVYPVACPDNDLSYYEMDLADLTGAATTVGNDKKMNSGKYATFNITGLPAGEYEVYAKAHVSTGNEVANATVGMSTGAQLSTAGANGGDPVPGRYYAYVGEEATAEKVYTDTGDKNFNAIGLNDASKFLWSTEAIIPSMMIGANQTSFTFKHTGAGYSLYLESIRLVRVGTYMPPAKNVVFTEGAMKIEAEDYSVKHTIFTNTGEETDYTTNGSQYPVSLNGTIEEDETASGGQYVHGVFREGWNNSKRSNMSGELQYRVKLAADAKVKIKAKIKSDMETEKVCFDLKVDGAAKGTLNAANAWVEVESDAIDLAAGVHTISFIGEQLGQSESYRSVLADIDCFTLVEQAAE